ncbi:MAG: hypothetical protein ACRDS0_31075 [Pseudonocardiaceae bacterium]
MEEVAGQHRRCLGAHELPPCGVGLSLGCWRDPQGLEDSADRRDADPVAELEQFTLDPFVPPAGVLPRKALDQRGGLGTDRRPAGALWVGPFPGDQAAVSSQHGARRDQPMCPQVPGQQPDERGKHRTIAQSGRGLGLARRGTAISWRKTSSSTLL